MTHETPTIMRAARTILNFRGGTMTSAVELAHDLQDAGVITPEGHRWEYGVEVRPDEHSEWQHVGPWWDTPEQARAWRGRATIRMGHPYPHDRIVHRLVGAVEVVEG